MGLREKLGRQPPRPCVIRVRQPQESPKPPSQEILQLEETDSFLRELPTPPVSCRQVTWKDVTVNGAGSAAGRGAPKAEARCGVGARSGMGITCGVEALDPPSGHLPSLNLEQPTLLGKLPQVLATARRFSPAPGRLHLTQLPGVPGGARGELKRCRK